MAFSQVVKGAQPNGRPRELIEASGAADSAPELVDGSFCGLAQVRFELGEGRSQSG
jgi:hypothetical protein